MNLQEYYNKEVLPKLKEKFNYKNNLAAPGIDKVVLNVGFGRHSRDDKFIQAVESNLAKISGQKPVLTKAKKSISSFKIREGMTIGAKVTLRGKRRFDFIEKLVKISFPRVRDFRGISEKSVDKQGNLSVGFKEHSAFPEIETQDIDMTHGLEVIISTTAETREEGLELFRLLNFPFKKDNK